MQNRILLYIWQHISCLQLISMLSYGAFQTSHVLHQPTSAEASLLPGYLHCATNIRNMQSWCERLASTDVNRCTAMKSECTITYRLITAYLLLRVNLDKIMHARWDFDASSARTRRVSALDKHQNWSASALFCLNSRAQSKYAVVNLIHTWRKQTFCLLLCDK